MKNTAMMIAAGISLFAVSAPAQDEGSAARPYAGIVSRNIFGLAPPKPEVPSVEAAVLPKITLQGTMTIFGKLQVLFTVASAAEPGQPSRMDFFVLRPGEAEQGVGVVQVNPADGTVVFNNHGSLQQLPMSIGRLR
jgi:hypothetical protein